MALGEITIGIPDGTASGFATTPVSSLTIKSRMTNRTKPRGKRPSVRLLNTSMNGTSQIGGESYAARFLWTINCVLSDEDAFHLNKLANWQADTYQNQSDGKLRLIDETKLIDEYERAVNGRALLTNLTDPDNGTFIRGYGIFNVLLQIPEDFGANFDTFQAVEV